jgi:chemotaxis protein CheX
MKKENIMPFVEATQNVFMDFFEVTPVLGNPYIVKKDNLHWDVSGVIGIAGELKGVVVLSFNHNIATSLTSKLVKKEISTLDNDVVDTIAELANIIAGNSKKGFEEHRLQISLPSVVIGKEHQFFWPIKKELPILSIPFSVPEGEFMLSVSLETKITNNILL